MKKIMLLAVTMIGLSSVLRAQTADDPWKKEMENKIDVLTQELEKSKLAPSETSSPATSANPAAPVQVAPYSFGPAAGKVYGIDHGLAIGGYGELIYQNFAHSTAGSINGDENQPRSAEINLARWVMYFGYRFTDKLFFNSELEIESANSSKSGEVEAEFAYLDYAMSKPLGFRVGELLIPVGLTNEYHEPVVFHGVLRPDVEEFLIPTTWHENGVGYYGQLGPFAYRGYLVAALRAAQDPAMNQTGFQPDIALQEGQQEGSNSRAHDLAYAQRLDYIDIPGWLFGGSIYYGNTGQDDYTPSGVQINAPLTLWELHVRGEHKGFEMRALYTQSTIGGVGQINQANGLTGNQSVGQYLWGTYIEVAYNVLRCLAPTSNQYVSPFFRYERYNTQGTVPAGYASDGANNRTVYTMGLSYKPIPRLVLKADYQIRNNTAGTGVNQFNLGTGYEF